MSTPNLQHNGKGPQDFNNRSGDKKEEKEDTVKKEPMEGRVSKLMKKLQKQRYNFAAQQKSNKEEAALQAPVYW